MNKTFLLNVAPAVNRLGRTERSAWRPPLLAAILLPLLAASLSQAAGESNASDTSAASPEPLFDVCELYAVGHFGNSYEVMGDLECRDVLTEAKRWGFNHYCDWFDSSDCRNPFVGGHSYGMGEALLETKTRHYVIAQELGLAPAAAVNPNHVYIDQCLPDLLATKGPRIQGQLICPSIPEARAIILKNFDDYFAHLAQAGVRLHALMPCPYDYGGCGCEKCKPWIITFAKLTHEIYGIARKYHPDVKINMLGWWWTAEEHRQFADWADANAPGWVDTMYLHIPYEHSRVAMVPLPKGCQRGAFVHIGHNETNRPHGQYTHLGPVIAAERIEETVINLKAQGVTAVIAYSEGTVDDVNKALLGGLASGTYQTSDEILTAYAMRYFRVDEPTARKWAAWLKAWGQPFRRDTAKSAGTLKKLQKATPEGDWRLRQWELKQELFAANEAIGTGNRWTLERLAAVERFWAVQEKIQRGLWGLAPQRHIFARRYTPTPWYRSWAEHQRTEARSVSKEQ